MSRGPPRSFRRRPDIGTGFSARDMFADSAARVLSEFRAISTVRRTGADSREFGLPESRTADITAAAFTDDPVALGVSETISETVARRLGR
jgi:hypothetical protein